MKNIVRVSLAGLTLSLTAGPVLATEGLTESVWHGVPVYDFVPTAADITSEQNYAATTKPDYTFINTVDGFKYPNQNFDWAAPNTIATWFGADAAGAALTDTKPTPSGDFSFDASGFIHVTKAGEYTFDLGDKFNQIDDAARVTVDGVIVAQQNFGAGTYLGLTPYASTVDLGVGYHSFDVFYFQTYNGYGLTLDTSAPAGTSVYYTTTAVPEPATWAMMVLGFAGLGFMGHRKAQRRTIAA